MGREAGSSLKRLWQNSRRQGGSKGLKATLWRRRPGTAAAQPCPGPHLATSLRSGEQPQSCRLWKGRWWLLGCKCKSPPSTRQRRKQSLGGDVGSQGRAHALAELSSWGPGLGTGQLRRAAGSSVCLGRGGGGPGLVFSPPRLCPWCQHAMPTLARTALSAKEQTLARRFRPRNLVRSQWACSKWDFILLLL